MSVFGRIWQRSVFRVSPTRIGRGGADSEAGLRVIPASVPHGQQELARCHEFRPRFAGSQLQLAEAVAGQLSVEWRLYILSNPLPADSRV